MEWVHYDFDLGVPSSEIPKNRIIGDADRIQRFDLSCEIRVSVQAAGRRPARKVLTSVIAEPYISAVARA
jgi:hypothetical protein